MFSFIAKDVAGPLNFFAVDGFDSNCCSATLTSLLLLFLLSFSFSETTNDFAGDGEGEEEVVNE